MGLVDRSRTLLRRAMFGNWLAHVVVTRRCNLACGYCNEYDKSSKPVPLETLKRVVDKLKSLGTVTLELTGGEPLLHPELVALLRYARDVGIPRRRMITNGFLLTRETIEALNEVGLHQLSLSVDGVEPNETTEKVLSQLRKRLPLLEQHAKFRVQLGAVLGSTNLAEATEVLDYARDHGFVSNLNILHDENGQLELSPEMLEQYRMIVQRIHGKKYDVRGDYRWRLVNGMDADFRCRSGSRYLYIDEFQRATWCSQTRASREFKSIFEYTWNDMEENFYTPKSCSAECTLGCSRRVARLDEWRAQSG
ncbi:MAG: radical SAM protein [Kofleriaceae bacterium]